MILDNLVDALFNNLMELMPFVLIRKYERGCRFYRFGARAEEIGPGLRIRVWLYHSVEKVNVVPDVIELPLQSIITKDERPLCFKVALGYTVTDVVQHFCGVADFLDSTKAAAMIHLTKKVREMTLKEIVEDLSKIEASLKRTLTTLLKDWGVEVTSVGFIDFSEVRHQLRLFSSERITKDVVT